MRQNPLCLAFLMVALFPAASFAADNDGASTTKFRRLSDAHATLQTRLAALQQEVALLQKEGAANDPKLHAQLAKDLAELPAEVKSYGALQKDLQIPDGGLAEQLQTEIQAAVKFQSEFWKDQDSSPAGSSPADSKFPAQFGKVRDQVAQLLITSARQYPQLARPSVPGDGSGVAPQIPPPPSLNGAASKIANSACVGTAFDGGGGCGGGNLPPTGNGRPNFSAPAGVGATSGAAAPGGAAVNGAPAVAGSDVITNTSNGALSGGRVRLDQAAAGIEGLGGAKPSEDDDLKASPDQLLSGKLKGILAKDPKAVNARDYLARYQAVKSDPAALAAWTKEAEAYIQFKEGGHVMGAVQQALAAAANPASLAGGKPDTATSEACWQALAKEHPDFAQGCADNPRTAAMMAGASQAIVEQAKGLINPLTIGIMLGTLLVSGLASGGVADVIALLAAIGFTGWMIFKIMSEYGPKLLSSLRDLWNSKSGSAESFQKWKESSYYFTTTLLSVVMIYLGSKGIASLGTKLASLGGKATMAAEASAATMGQSATLGQKASAVGTALIEDRPGLVPKTVAAGREARAISASADALIQKATAAEPRVTANLQKIVHENGGEMVGLKNRLKTAKSLTEKISGDVSKDNLSVSEAAGSIGDVLRYTSVLPEESFARGTQATLNRLVGEGYKIRKIKNTFQTGSIYKGINSSLISPDGQVFELQFHTEQSFEVKSSMHAEYETLRDPGASLEARRAAYDKMAAAAATIKEPGSVESIGTLQPLAARP